jgi:hypothetical protein
MLAGLRAFGVNLEHKDGKFEANPFVRDLIAANKIRDIGAAHKYVQVIEDINDDRHRIQALNWIDSGVGQSVPKEVPTMHQSTQIYFVLREVIEILLKNRGIHDGHWIPVLKFSTAGTNIGLNGGEPLPAAVIQVQEIGLQRVDEPVPGSVSAALVNPAPDA